MEVAGPRDLTSGFVEGSSTDTGCSAAQPSFGVSLQLSPEGRVDLDSSTMAVPSPTLGSTPPRVLHSTHNSSAEIGEADALLRR